MRTSSKCPRVESSGVAPPFPSSIGDTTTEEPVDYVATAADVPPPPTSDDLDIQRMLEIVMTVQRLMVRFWWTCLMSFMLCERIWSI